MFFTKSFNYRAVTIFRTHEQEITNIKYLAETQGSATIPAGLRLFEITVITSVITTICAGLQLLETTLQGEKLLAGIGGGLPKA